MPPSLMEWLPEDHFAWFVLAAVKEMDLDAFYGAYRVDGHGRAAHDPAMMVGLLVYAYARGRRSSRQIERACVEDIGYRVIAANQVPDHCTIARFRQRHEQALAGLFSEVLALCADAGLVDVTVLAVDGTKIYADASRDAARDYDQIAAEVLAEADAVDRAEDEQFGAARGDELPAHLSTHQGRRGWLRDAKRALDEKRAKEAKPIPSSRPDRLREEKRRLEEDHARLSDELCVRPGRLGSVSVGQSVSEVDLEGCECGCPGAGGPPFRFGSFDGEVDELGGGLFVGEVAAGLDRLADLAVHGLDRVGNRYERR